MSNKEFLDRMRGIAEEYGSQGSAGFVTQILVEFGFRAWVDDGMQRDPLTFWKRCEDKSEADVIKAELQARLDEQKLDGKLHFTLRVFADKNTVGRDANDWHTNKFFDEWQWDKKPDGPETCFNLIIASMEKNNLPYGEKFWGRYELKGNPYYIAQGNSGKVPNKKDPTKKYFPSFPLPVEKFANEQAARDAVGSAGSGRLVSTSGQYSDTVYENYDSEAAFELNFKHIQDYYKIMAEKNTVPYKDAPEFTGPWLPPRIKQYLAQKGLYGCETSDIDLALAAIPF